MKLFLRPLALPCVTPEEGPGELMHPQALRLLLVFA